jgi:hypothetical protein
VSAAAGCECGSDDATGSCAACCYHRGIEEAARWLEGSPDYLPNVAARMRAALLGKQAGEATACELCGGNRYVIGFDLKPIPCHMCAAHAPAERFKAFADHVGDPGTSALATSKCDELTRLTEGDGGYDPEFSPAPAPADARQDAEDAGPPWNGEPAPAPAEGAGEVEDSTPQVIDLMEALRGVCDACLCAGGALQARCGKCRGTGRTPEGGR